MLFAVGFTLEMGRQAWVGGTKTWPRFWADQACWLDTPTVLCSGRVAGMDVMKAW